MITQYTNENKLFLGNFHAFYTHTDGKVILNVAIAVYLQITG